MHLDCLSLDTQCNSPDIYYFVLYHTIVHMPALVLTFRIVPKKLSGNTQCFIRNMKFEMWDCKQKEAKRIMHRSGSSKKA